VNYLELLRLVMPEATLTVVALAVLGADMFALQDVERRTRNAICSMLTAAGCVVAGIWVLGASETTMFMDGLLVLDSTTGVLKAILLLLTASTALLSARASFTEHLGEYFALILIATVGLMLLVSSENMLLIFVSLELTSVALYLLTAINIYNQASVESAFKYFVFGSTAAAFTLFGFSLLYGVSGSTNLREMAHVFAEHGTLGRIDPLLALAAVMTLAGFTFKVAAAPFHLWAPDVYQGAPLPSAALIASGSKVAGFYILAKVAVVGFGGQGAGQEAPGWAPALIAVAVMSMLLGNLAAIVQSSLRRLLAYSAVAHAGYMLLAILSPGTMSLPSLMYYAVTYALAGFGAFAFVSWFRDRTGDADVQLRSLAGLGRSAPLASACMLVFVLSLAGIPPLPGFFAKFYVFAGTLRSGLSLTWVVLLALAMSSVSLYYYLQILKQIYVVEPAAQKPVVQPLMAQFGLLVLALLVIVAGCFPERLVASLTP
jgi:NADH-quinone oxidoreductase subunit N